ARSHRRGLRSVREPARERAQDRDQTLSFRSRSARRPRLFTARPPRGPPPVLGTACGAALLVLPVISWTAFRPVDPQCRRAVGSTRAREACAKQTASAARRFY